MKTGVVEKSFNESDDLTIGFKGIINDMYCKDTSRRISAGYLQKQREGIIIVPPLGYFKDKNTDEVVIIEEEAEIVRMIYDLYLQGYGLKNIAHQLNSEGVKSPLYYQNKKMKKKTMSNAPKITSRFLWTSTTVKRILTNEFYKGTLVCHKTHTNKIYQIREGFRLRKTSCMKTLYLLSFPRRNGSRYNLFSGRKRRKTSGQAQANRVTDTQAC